MIRERHSPVIERTAVEVPGHGALAFAMRQRGRSDKPLDQSSGHPHPHTHLWGYTKHARSINVAGTHAIYLTGGDRVRPSTARNHLLTGRPK